MLGDEKREATRYAYVVFDDWNHIAVRYNVRDENVSESLAIAVLHECYFVAPKQFGVEICADGASVNSISFSNSPDFPGLDGCSQHKVREEYFDDVAALMLHIERETGWGFNEDENDTDPVIFHIVKARWPKDESI